MLRVDRRTHRYLIEPLSEMKHLKRMLLGSFHRFTQKLSISPKNAVRNMFDLVHNDCRSVTGSNIRNIMLDCVKDPSRPFSNVGIEKATFYPAPTDATWEVLLLKELIDMRDGVSTHAGWTLDEINDTIYHLCTS